MVLDLFGGLGRILHQASAATASAETESAATESAVSVGVAMASVAAPEESERMTRTLRVSGFWRFRG